MISSKSYFHLTRSEGSKTHLRMNSLELPLYIVDTFTKFDGKQFSGNPAAVLILDWDDEIEDEVKQDIAQEINQPVTVFISRGWTCSLTDSKPRSVWTARWFTPISELSVCGHASIAAASVLISHIAPELNSITLEGKNGEHLELGIDRKTGLVSVNFPSHALEKLNPEESWIQELANKTIFDSQPTAAGAPDLILQDVFYSPVGRKILFHLKASAERDPEQLLRNLTPNLAGMVAVVPKSLNLIGVSLTIQNNGKEMQSPLFFSRFFAPWVGIDEDQVCGSLHAALGPFWSKKLDKGNVEMMSGFASPRSGDIVVKLIDEERVSIAGKTVLRTSGTFFLQN